jgi:hypothetical protein
MDDPKDAATLSQDNTIRQRFDNILGSPQRADLKENQAELA